MEKMKTKINWIIAFLILGVIFSGCSPRAKYDRLLKSEVASGVRNDSLFMGLYLGMPEKEFYLHCWNLNKKGLIKQGENNVTVLHELKNELKFPAFMDFYPKFNDGTISELPVRFKYTGWAPWNKELTSQKLQADIVRYCEKIFGAQFLEVKDPKRGSAFVTIKGNRRISVFIQSDLYVWAVFTDMLVKNNWNSSLSNGAISPVDTTKIQK